MGTWPSTPSMPSLRKAPPTPILRYPHPIHFPTHPVHPHPVPTLAEAWRAAWAQLQHHARVSARRELDHRGAGPRRPQPLGRLLLRRRSHRRTAVPIREHFRHHLPRELRELARGPRLRRLSRPRPRGSVRAEYEAHAARGGGRRCGDALARPPAARHPPAAGAGDAGACGTGELLDARRGADCIVRLGGG